MSTNQSKQQFDSVHLYLDQVAKALAQDGHTMQDVVKAIRKAEIMPTKNAMKEVVWKPLLEIISGKDSTTKQDSTETQQVFEAMNKWLGQEFQVHVPFPSEQVKSLEQYEKQIRAQQNIDNF
jgi:maltose-binding protein MalE